MMNSQERWRKLVECIFVDFIIQSFAAIICKSAHILWMFWQLVYPPQCRIGTSIVMAQGYKTGYTNLHIVWLFNYNVYYIVTISKYLCSGYI